MLHPAVRTWAFRRRRLALLLLGAMLMSAGLGFLLSAEESVGETVRQLVSDYWRSSYDILARPPGQRSDLEAGLDLIEPNALVSLRGGITRAQWEQIRALPEVEVAAPLANLGAGGLMLRLPWTTLSPGLYRVRTHWEIDLGIQRQSGVHTGYALVQESYDWSRPPPPGVSGPHLSAEVFETRVGGGIMVAGVDPAEEARLVGLDSAVVRGRYFTPEDLPVPRRQGTLWEIPVLANVTRYVEMSEAVEIERLEAPGPAEVAAAVAREGAAYLDGLRGTLVFSGARDADEMHGRLLAAAEAESSAPLGPPPDPIRYRQVHDPELAGRYPTLLQAVPLGAVVLEGESGGGAILWRPQQFGGEEHEGPAVLIQFRPVGQFETARLEMAMDRVNELPMETYRPPTALLRLDGRKQPVEPPLTLRPVPNMAESGLSFLTPPPVLLTTLDAAEKVLGPAPIAAIRIRVRGMGPAGDAGWRQLERVADRIRELTGLEAEITAGSSPRRALTHIPGWEGEARVIGTDRTTRVHIPSLGYLEFPWVQKGFGLAVIHETRLARTLVLWALLGVGVLFAFTASMVSAAGWRRDVGLLSALGAPPPAVMGLMVGEVVLIGAVAGLGGWLVAQARGLPGLDLAPQAAVLGLPVLVFTVGVLPAAGRLARSAPAALLRGAEPDQVVSRQPLGPTPLGLAQASLLRRPWRNLLTVMAFGLPAGLLGFLAFLTLVMGGRLSVTLLGAHIALRAGSGQYAALALATLLAAIQTMDQIWLTLQERRAEMGLLTALGVPPRALYLTVVAEGGLLGAAGGLAGAAAATAALYGVYGALPAGVGLVWAVALAVPAAFGAGAALVPAAAVLRLPAAGVLQAE